MLEQQLTMIGVAAFVVVALEVWRRALRNRAPRWVLVVAVLLTIEIVVGVGYAEYQLHEALHHIQSEDASNKATALATDISRAMNSNAIAVAGVLLEVLVLAIGSVLARRGRRGTAPVAKLR